MIYSRTEAVICLDKIEQNLENMHKNLKETTKVVAVIKANGYGHGAVEVGQLLQEKEYIWGFAVATVEEGIILRNNGLTKPILLLGVTFPEQFEEAISNDLTLAVFGKEAAMQLSFAAGKVNKTAKVHLKVDTGMGRIGIGTDESGLAEMGEMYCLPNLEWEGIFTHMARADEADKSVALEQISRFKAFIQELEQAGVTFSLHHCANSAGLMEIPEADLDLVRAGISMYGLMPSEEVDMKRLGIEPALEWKTRITYIKEMEADMPISYGGTYRTGGKERIATLPIGYADGYPRSLSNKGYVLIHGKKAPIRGRICMDQCMVDVTGIPEAKAGDEVTLIGQDGDEVLTMDFLGELSGRFNYEFACELNRRIPRVYYYKGEMTSTKPPYFE